MAKEYILGIDLGTTNSCVSIIENGDSVVISSSEGGRTIPSVVAWKKSGERIVGVAAKRGAVVDPKNTISSVKRFMGHKFDEVQNEKTSYTVKSNDKGLAVVDIPNLGKTLTPEEVSAAILSKIKADVEAYLGEPVSKAVITVPAYFNDSQRQSTKVAGEIAGLEVIRIINEPTAAALAYGAKSDKEGHIFVFDLGGGTYDNSILQIGDGTFEVLATSGDSHLGGDDFDNKLVDYIVSENKKSTGVDISKDPSALQRIKEAAEKAKIELSSQMSSNVNLPFITAVDGNPVHLDIEISRSKFESLVKDLLDRIKKPVLDVLKEGVGKDKIDEVILVGGSSRIPCVQALIKDLIGIEPNKHVNPDEAVAIGAAIQGGILAGDVKGLVLLDVTPISLSVEINGGLVDVLIPKNTTIPTNRKNVYSTAQDGQNSVTINILQGERALAKDNKSLGLFNLHDIPSARRGVPQIEVSFDLNSNGILSVKAVDLGTKKEQSITISNSSNLSPEEIEKMIKESEEFAAQDIEAKNFILLKNELETHCYSAESTVELAKDKADQNLIDSVLEAIVKAKEALGSDDKESIESAKNELIKCTHALSEVLYASEPIVEPEPEPASQ